MITAYVPKNGIIERVEVGPDQPLPPDALWIDLFEPTPAETAMVQSALGVALPTREEMREIEPSSRLYVEGDASYMTAQVLSRADEPNPMSEPLTFVLTRRALITLRYSDPRPIASYASRICRQAATCNSAEDALVGLIEAFVDRIADILEKAGSDLDAVSRQIFSVGQGGKRTDERDLQTRPQGARAQRRPGLDHAGKPAEPEPADPLPRRHARCQRQADKKLAKDLRLRTKIVVRDIASLNEHASFELHKVNFLLDATLGMINIEQNRIIKLFSVAAVVFLPPTLVASIYGMNFDVMPELKWALGYPWALLLMALSAVLPYMYFKRKGWF